jgi:hypothetical protein
LAVASGFFRRQPKKLSLEAFVQSLLIKPLLSPLLLASLGGPIERPAKYPL